MPHLFGQCLHVFVERLAQILRQLGDFLVACTFFQCLSQRFLGVPQFALGCRQVAILDRERKIPEERQHCLEVLVRLRAHEFSVGKAHAEVVARLEIESLRRQHERVHGGDYLRMVLCIKRQIAALFDDRARKRFAETALRQRDPIDRRRAFLAGLIAGQQGQIDFRACPGMRRQVADRFRGFCCAGSWRKRQGKLGCLDQRTGDTIHMIRIGERPYSPLGGNNTVIVIHQIGEFQCTAELLFGIIDEAYFRRVVGPDRKDKAHERFLAVRKLHDTGGFEFQAPLDRKQPGNARIRDFRIFFGIDNQRLGIVRSGKCHCQFARALRPHDEDRAFRNGDRRSGVAQLGAFAGQIDRRFACVDRRRYPGIKPTGWLDRLERILKGRGQTPHIVAACGRQSHQQQARGENPEGPRIPAIGLRVRCFRADRSDGFGGSALVQRPDRAGLRIVGTDRQIVFQRGQRAVTVAG